MIPKQKVALIIMDGWGKGNATKSDAISTADTPFIDDCLKNKPNAKLRTDGLNVGLPEGQMGNSEVGHLNIGGGRKVYQDLVKINLAIDNGAFYNEKELTKAFEDALYHNKQVHLMGLVSNGGVHSSMKHLYALCTMAKNMSVPALFIHALMDGRDTDPRSGVGYLMELQNHLSQTTGTIATVSGRYYAMDRDKRWERIKIGYDMLMSGIGEPSFDVIKSLQQSYEAGITDEFVKPIVKIDSNNKPITTFQEGDVVICFNFRTDRCREITTVFTQQDMASEKMKTLPLYWVTMTNYNSAFKNVNVVYDKENLQSTLGEVIAKNNLHQVRIAETEKYAHVTFFFSGGREKEFTEEKRILINSPKVATYDLQPEMSAYLVAEAICEEIDANKPDFICLNFANSDMVGHTGVYNAILKAVSAVDKCVKKVAEKAIKNNYAIVIIADHGNSDNAINADGSPNTAHSMNPVPFIVLNSEYKHVSNGILADIAPTILKIMGLPQPEEMTGQARV